MPSFNIDRNNDLINCKRSLGVDEYDDGQKPKRKCKDQYCDRCIRFLFIQSSSMETDQLISIVTDCKNTITGNEQSDSLKNSGVRLTSPKTK